MEKKTDLRIIKTQMALSNALLEILNEKRFDELTVNELCERAMVRRATFYKHFADKYEFFGFFVHQIQEEFVESCRQEQKNSGSDYQVYLTKQTILFFKNHEKLVNSVVKSSAFPTLLDILAQEIYQNILLNEKEKAASGIKPSVAPEILATFYSGGIIQIFRFWIEHSKTISEEDLMKQFEMLFQSFQPNETISTKKTLD